MLTLITDAEVYCPEYIGKKDVLIAGSAIAGIYSPGSVKIPIPDIHRVNANGKLLTPGFIDGHVHIAGAGGEGGPLTRTEGLRVEDMIRAGVTTVVGCLGTDGFTRSIESVLMKVKQLRTAGVSAWMYTGSYQVPPLTLLGDVGRDITLIDEILGAGEIAVGDHRSSCPTAAEIARIAAHARVAGLLSGKAGIVNIHIGSSSEAFRILNDVLRIAQFSSNQFWPTHCARSREVFENAIVWGQHGYVDITASDEKDEHEIAPWDAAVQMVSRGVPESRITFTSDACGSLPRFNEQGELIGMDYGKSDSLLYTVTQMIDKHAVPVEKALAMITRNPAEVLKLTKKGRIAVGCDADVILLNAKTLAVESVYAYGRMLLS